MLMNYIQGTSDVSMGEVIKHRFNGNPISISTNGYWGFPHLKQKLLPYCYNKGQYFPHYIEMSIVAN